jgi:serine/threonine protein kinase
MEDAMEHSAGNLIGKTLGTCVLESLIGQGGMGAVYLAKQIRPSRYVAVKILLPMVTGDSQMNKEFLVRFRQEADVIARLDHINIMPIYEYGEQDGLAYLVMPRLPGGSLRDVLAQKGALSLQDAAAYINQAASALDYAHVHSVIHRDLKPGNFLLHQDGRLVLADFGIARIIQESDSTVRANLTRTGMLLGTPEYMAPEMVLGEQIDARADIYALGIVLFQMVSGYVPFQGNTPFAVANKQLQEPIPLLHQINPAIPPAVDTVISKALAKRREDRYTSAGAMAQDLRTVIAAPHSLTEDEIRNAPTVLSPQRLQTPAIATPSNDRLTPPPTNPPIPVQTQFALPTIHTNNASSRRFAPDDPASPVTPYPAPQAPSRQQALLLIIGLLLVLILVIGGILVGLQLNKGTTTTTTSNTPITQSTVAPNFTTTTHTATMSALQPTQGSTPTVQPTSTQPIGIPKGTALYSVTTPGRPCDSHGGHWANYNSPTITCQGSGTLIDNPHPQSPNLVGTLLTAMPNGSFPSNYVVEAQLQQLGTADFGIYFRNQPGNQNGIYTFFLHSNGTWSAYVYDNTTGAPSEIAGGSLNGVFNNGSGLIDVVVSGPNFTFYVNNKLVGRANDTTYPSGTVGIAVDAGGSILVSNFALYTVST